jgi:hypothetical protein
VNSAARILFNRSVIEWWDRSSVPGTSPMRQRTKTCRNRPKSRSRLDPRRWFNDDGVRQSHNRPSVRPSTQMPSRSGEPMPARIQSAAAAKVRSAERAAALCHVDHNYRPALQYYFDGPWLHRRGSTHPICWPRLCRRTFAIRPPAS